MMNIFTQHKGIIVIIALLAAGALWYGMSQSGSESSSAIVASGSGVATDAGDSTVANALDPETQKILDLLLALRSIQFDDTIFSNPAFVSLRDFTTKIVPEPAGRPDPFAPLGAGGTLNSSTGR
jgi:hypothetical protein